MIANIPSPYNVRFIEDVIDDFAEVALDVNAAKNWAEVK